MKDYSKYIQYFSEKGFLMLIKGPARKLFFIKDAVAMYYCLKDERTPKYIKAAIMGALGYFILPLDIAPDWLPVVGWLDDAGVLSAVLFGIRSFVKPEHKQKASELLGVTIKWPFGKKANSEIEQRGHS